MKQCMISTLSILLLASSQAVIASPITDEYKAGDILSAEKLTNIKNAVNDNDSAITRNTKAVAGSISSVTAGSGLTGGGTSGNVTISVGSNAISSAHIQNEAGIDFSQSSNFGTGLAPAAANTWKALKTITMTTPSAGYINCISTGIVRVNDPTSTGFLRIGWGINNTGTTAANSHTIFQAVGLTTPSPHMPFSTMHTHQVAKGTNTFTLKLLSSSSDTSDFTIYPTSNACMFFPTRY